MVKYGETFSVLVGGDPPPHNRSRSSDILNHLIFFLWAWDVSSWRAKQDVIPKKQIVTTKSSEKLPVDDGHRLFQPNAGDQAPEGWSIPIELPKHETGCNYAFKSDLCTCVGYEG